MLNWLPFQRLGRAARWFYCCATLASIGLVLGAMKVWDFGWSDGWGTAAAICLLLFWFSIAMVHQSKFRFSTRGLLVVITLVAFGCSWFASRYMQAQQTDRIAAQLRLRGAIVHYGLWRDMKGWFKTRGGYVLPNWVRRTLGNGFFSKITGVSFRIGSEANDEDLAILSELQGLQRLDLGNTKATGNLLKVIEGLPKLRHIVLRADQLNDIAVSALPSIVRLRTITLASPYKVFRDDALQHIHRFTTVSRLELVGAGITDASMAKIAGSKAISSLHLTHTRISTAGVRQLGTMPSVSLLVIKGDIIKEEGVETLEKMTQLSQLALMGTRLKYPRLVGLATKIPDCHLRFSRPSQPSRTLPVVTKKSEKKPAADPQTAAKDK